jgi:MoaA/NifB/PqqE/SkfB family radical SAM enzyme
MSIETEQNLIERNIVLSALSDQDKSTRFIPKRFLLQWHVTETCNLQCTHCYQLSNPDEQELPYKGMLDILGQFIRLLNEWGIRGHINFSGGEPFCKEGFLDFLKEVYNYKKICSFAVLSNGTLLNKDSVVELKKLKCRFVQVSIEGDEKTHDSIRGDGTFSRALESLKLLRANRITSMVSFTSHKQNNRDFDHDDNVCMRFK